MTVPTPLPVVQAPMAGGPSTRQLAVAVAQADGFAYVAAGYLTADALTAAIADLRAATDAPFGVNLFLPSQEDARVDPDAIAAYARALEPEAGRLGATLGEPRWEDDEYDAKVEVLAAARVHTVSCTFGCPTADVVARLHSAGSQVAVTVTSVDEARAATEAGADSLVVQGTEAGGHQGGFLSPDQNHTTLLDALAAIAAAVDVPLVAAGGIVSVDTARAARAAGASAVQLGTALLLCPEAGTSPVHRAALTEPRFADTTITRAFSGRWARGLVNRWAREHPDAPRGYPQIHHLTRPLRAAATKAGDPDVPNLWAGTGWREATAEPAGEVVRRIGAGFSSGRDR